MLRCGKVLTKYIRIGYIQDQIKTPVDQLVGLWWEIFSIFCQILNISVQLPLFHFEKKSKKIKSNQQTTFFIGNFPLLSSFGWCHPHQCHHQEDSDCNHRHLFSALPKITKGFHVAAEAIFKIWFQQENTDCKVLNKRLTPYCAKVWNISQQISILLIAFW